MAKDIERLKNRLARMRKRYDDERLRVKAYEQIVRMYSAYIALLLRALGATTDEPFLLKHKDITMSLKELETRALPTDEGFEMYVEVIGDEHNISAETSEATGTETDKS